MARSGGTPTTWTAASGGRNDGATATLSARSEPHAQRERESEGEMAPSMWVGGMWGLQPTRVVLARAVCMIFG